MRFARSALRATVDTSAWVSAVLSRRGRLAQIFAAFTDGRLTMVTSEPLHAETTEVLGRPHVVRSGPARADARRLIAEIRSDAEFVPLPGTLTLCRDPKDDMVIETALRGDAEVLVTEDKDLLEDQAVRDLLALSGIRVLTVAQFLAELTPAPDEIP
jgi:putative PIN family toxin of toxin-antitoxin system